MSDNSSTPEKTLSGLEKASVLVMSLGAAASAKLFEQLTPTERELLGSQILQLRPIDEDERSRVMHEAPVALQNLAASQTPMPLVRDSVLTRIGGAAGVVLRRAIGRSEPGDHVDEPVEPESPEDLARLPEAEVKFVLSGIAVEDLCLILSVAGDELRAVVLANLPAPICRVVIKQLDEPGEMRLGEIEQARARLMERITAVHGERVQL